MLKVQEQPIEAGLPNYLCRYRGRKVDPASMYRFTRMDFVFEIFHSTCIKEQKFNLVNPRVYR